MLVQTVTKDSRIHGKGLFAAIPIPLGSVLWRFMPPDRRILLAHATFEQKHYGYVNPDKPNWLVICGDHACFWNFGLNGEANCGPSSLLLDEGENAIIALRDIAVGEELLITVDSDADACRKLQGTWHASDKDSTPSFRR